MTRSESLPTGRRVLRWVGWLAAGVALGVFAGFVAGLGATAPGAPRTTRAGGDL